MESDRIRKHIVKPSSPTPHTLKTHKFSSLDQTHPLIYIPFIFLYKNEESQQHEEIWPRLKQSLSDILTIFYPLAGRIKQNTHVDCDDTGAEMVEARVHARLAQFTQNPNMEELQRLLPIHDSKVAHNDDSALLLVKTSFFDCGGMAVGVCLSHKIADMASFVMFMNAWATTCREGEASRIIRPSFDLASHFPPCRKQSGPLFVLAEEKYTTKRLVFDKEKVERLRQEASSKNNDHYPSRVEAVSAFFWRNLNPMLPAAHILNLRPRTVPSLPDYAFGNCIMMVVAENEEEEEEDALVTKLRGAIRAVDDDYINNVIKDSDKYFATQTHALGKLKSGYCSFTSWLRFPVYDVDFGWGKPVWFCTTTIPYMNLVVLVDTPSGNGIEAWVNVLDHDGDSDRDNVWRMLLASYSKLLIN